MYAWVAALATLAQKAIMGVAGQHQAIIVSNAQQELVDWLLQQKQTPRIVCTNAPMADGILEGIARHGLH
jgi:DNA-binding LacI/PurR family transcriptional regulator